MAAQQRSSVGGALGVMRMGVRLYDPRLGRFLSVDPVEGGSCNDYVCGDPVNMYDLAGTDATSDFLKSFSKMSKADQKAVLAYGAVQQKKQAAIDAYITNDRRGMVGGPDRLIETGKYVAPVVGFFVKVVRAVMNESTRPIIPPIPSRQLNTPCRFNPDGRGCPPLVA